MISRIRPASRRPHAASNDVHQSSREHRDGRRRKRRRSSETSSRRSSSETSSRRSSRRSSIRTTQKAPRRTIVSRLQALVTILAASKNAIMLGVSMAAYMQIGYMLLAVFSTFSPSQLRDLLNVSLTDLFGQADTQNDPSKSEASWRKAKIERLAALNMHDFSEELQGLDRYRYTAKRKIGAGRRDDLTLLESFALWEPVISPLMGVFGALALVKANWKIDFSKFFDLKGLFREAHDVSMQGQQRVSEHISTPGFRFTSTYRPPAPQRNVISSSMPSRRRTAPDKDLKDTEIPTPDERTRIAASLRAFKEAFEARFPPAQTSRNP